MAFDTLTAKMSPLELEPGTVLKFEAISPTTGAAITGVTVSAAVYYGIDRAAAAAGGGGDLLLGPFMFVPGPNA